MAGEGLIWSGIGQGIANAGSTMGQFMVQQELKKEDRTWREQQAQEQRDFRAEQNALYRRTADEQMAGRAGAGKDPGIQPADLQPGGKYAGMAAGQLGLTEDELADLQKYRKSGDLSKFAEEVPNRGEENVIAGSKEVPQALKDEFKLKAKALSQLEESYALKGSYDDVMKGRKIGVDTGVETGILAGSIPAERGAVAVAASEGKPLYKVEGGEKLQQYSGESSTTPLGQAQIGKEKAQAGELGALGKKYGKDIEKIDAEIQGGMFNKNSSERLTSVINSANATIKSLMDGGKGSTPEAKAAWQKSMDDATAVRDQAQALQKSALDNRDTGKTNPPAAKADSARKRGVWDPVAGRVVWK